MVLRKVYKKPTLAKHENLFSLTQDPRWCSSIGFTPPGNPDGINGKGPCKNF